MSKICIVSSHLRALLAISIYTTLIDNLSTIAAIKRTYFSKFSWHTPGLALGFTRCTIDSLHINPITLLHKVLQDCFASVDGLVFKLAVAYVKSINNSNGAPPSRLYACIPKILTPICMFSRVAMIGAGYIPRRPIPQVLLLFYRILRLIFLDTSASWCVVWIGGARYLSYTVI
jgi:hypothetical protein